MKTYEVNNPAIYNAINNITYRATNNKTITESFQFSRRSHHLNKQKQGYYQSEYREGDTPKHARTIKKSVADAGIPYQYKIENWQNGDAVRFCNLGQNCLLGELVEENENETNNEPLLCRPLHQE